MRVRLCLLIFLLVLMIFMDVVNSQIKKQIIIPEDYKIGALPYSPGVLAGDILYISGQTSKSPVSGQHPKLFPDQVRQALENVKSVLTPAKMEFKNIVSVNVYLDDLNNFDEMNKVYQEYFSTIPTVRTTLEVARLPGDSHIEITCIAVADESAKKPVFIGNKRQEKFLFCPGIFVDNILYLSGQGSRNPETKQQSSTFEEQIKQSLENVGVILKSAGLSFNDITWCNLYLDDMSNYQKLNDVYRKYFSGLGTPARGVIFVNKIPGDSHIEISSVASTNLLGKRVVRPFNIEPDCDLCKGIMIGDMLYLSPRSGCIPGQGIVTNDFELQLRQVMRNLLDVLQCAGMDFSNVVSSTVYLKDLNDYDKLNKIYGQFFNKEFPSRTCIQPYSNQKETDILVQISMIAVRFK